MIRRTLLQTQAATFCLELPAGAGLHPTGTGFFVSPDGWFLTAAHVITENGEPGGPVRNDINAGWLRKEGRDFKSGAMCQWPEVSQVLPEFDLAFLKLDFARNANKGFLAGKTEFPFLTISARQLDEGEPIYAFGYPLGDSNAVVETDNVKVWANTLRPRATAGIVSSTFDATQMVMTNAESTGLHHRPGFKLWQQRRSHCCHRNGARPRFLL